MLSGPRPGLRGFRLLADLARGRRRMDGRRAFAPGVRQGFVQRLDQVVSEAGSFHSSSRIPDCPGDCGCGEVPARRMEAGAAAGKLESGRREAGRGQSRKQ